MTDNVWGYHLVIDQWNCTNNAINDYNTIRKFAQELVKRIDMKAFGQPDINFFGEGNKQGYTLVQLIETSNICAHFVPSENAAFFDVFSCKSYDPAIVIDTIKEFFGGTANNIKFINRCLST